MAKEEEEVTKKQMQPTEIISPSSPPEEPAGSKFFTPDGKPLRVLSTSLGIALLANAFLIPAPGFRPPAAILRGTDRSWSNGRRMK